MRVLLATDGSNHSRHAEWIARRIPSIASGAWTVVTIVPPPILPVLGIEPIGAPMISDDMQSIFDAQLENARRVVGEAQARIGSAVVAVETKILEGNPGQEIVDLVEQGAYDVVVIGSRGLGGIEEFFLGSTAKHLLHKSAASILIGRKHGETTIEESISRLETSPKIQVGIGCDGSSGSDQAADRIANCGTGSFETVSLIAALPLSGIPAGIDRTDVKAAYEEEAADADAMLQGYADRLAGIADHVTKVQAHAEPADALMQYAKTKDLDLLVVGSDRHSLVERIVVGSTAEKIASQAPCSVWVVRPPRA